MKIEIKERPTQSFKIIDVEFDNNEYRIVLNEIDNSIEITKSDGSIEIHPKVSNQILIR